MSDPEHGMTHYRSIVKVFVVAQEPNQTSPWEIGYQRTYTGSGCIVDGNLILTNAHVTRYQAFMQVLKAYDSQKYTARVEFVDHESELALLSVDDMKFFENTEPVKIGELPPPQTPVKVYGFPDGGDELAISAGIVSRLEVRKYSHSTRRLLSLQIDAALNPGSSGGPVFCDGQVIGIAFQSRADLKKSGYLVPSTAISRFLESRRESLPVGVPDLGIYWQKLESPSLKQWLGLTQSQTGILVSRVNWGSSSSGVLRDGDVILKIGDSLLSGDGHVSFRTRERVEFTHLITSRRIGDVIRLGVMRNREATQFDVTLKAAASLIPVPIYSRFPTYYIYAGIVFMRLTYEYISYFEWNSISPRFKYYYAGAELPSLQRRRIVFVNRILPHAVNIGYHDIHAAPITRINGALISDIGDVVEALQMPVDGYSVIEIDHHGTSPPAQGFSACGTHIVVDATKASECNEYILQQYGIRSDRSSDLM